jgi:hypothetical protein
LKPALFPAAVFHAPFSNFGFYIAKSKEFRLFSIVQNHKENFSHFQIQCEFSANIVYSKCKRKKLGFMSGHGSGQHIDGREHFLHRQKKEGEKYL